jgi:hypothetical protein
VTTISHREGNRTWPGWGGDADGGLAHGECVTANHFERTVEVEVEEMCGMAMILLGIGGDERETVHPVNRHILSLNTFT